VAEVTPGITFDSTGSSTTPGALQNFLGSRDDVVGITTRYELNGLGFEHWWGRDFPHSSRWAVEPTQPLVLRTLGLFSKGKLEGVWR
jgi:hypothetical protein